MPLFSAFLTLSRVIVPTTRLGKRAFKVVNKLSTDICRGLSEVFEICEPVVMIYGDITCVSVKPVVGFEYDEAFLPCTTTRGSGESR